MKNKDAFNHFLISIWNEHAGKSGIEKYRSELLSFRERVSNVSRFKIFLCFFDQYYLSNYINFQLSRRKTINIFFKFSRALWGVYESYKNKAVLEKDWKRYLEEYFTCFEQQGGEPRLLIINEILKLTEK